MKLHFLLCAERAARTAEGQFILHCVLERVTVKEAPTAEAPLTMPTMSVAFEIREAALSQARKVDVTMHHKESGTQLFAQSFTVEPTQDPAQKISGLLNFHLLPIKALGEYVISVKVDGVEAGTTSFLVVKS